MTAPKLLYAHEIHREMLADAIINSTTDLEKALAERAMSSDSGLARLVNYYGVCFSAHDDLLTQWKTFGSWGAGFSIGFDRLRLEEAFKPSGTLVDLMEGFAAICRDAPRLRFKRLCCGLAPSCLLRSAIQL